MTSGTLATRVALSLAAAALVACSETLPVAPQADPETSVALARVTPVPGVYDLSFWNRGLQVTTLTVGQELILKAHVESATGAPAQGGSVTFQYCSLKGGPANDINRADEAPKSECENGTASWARLLSMNVNSSGDAYMNFGAVRIPRTVGFRFKYSSKGSGIADGTSEAKDFTWTAAQ